MPRGNNPKPSAVGPHPGMRSPEREERDRLHAQHKKCIYCGGGNDIPRFCQSIEESVWCADGQLNK